MNDGVLTLAIAAAIAVVYLVQDVAYRPKHRRGLPPVPRDNAVQAIDKMKDWGTWLTGLALAAIGAIGVLLPKDGALQGRQRGAAAVAVVLFGASVLVSTWLLSALPSLHLRLDSRTSADNDVYEARIFSFVPVRVGALAVLQHSYFVAASVAFAVFVYLKLFTTT